LADAAKAPIAIMPAKMNANIADFIKFILSKKLVKIVQPKMMDDIHERIARHPAEKPAYVLP